MLQNWEDEVINPQAKQPRTALRIIEQIWSPGESHDEASRSLRRFRGR